VKKTSLNCNWSHYGFRLMYAQCVWTVSAPTRNLLTYLLTYCTPVTINGNVPAHCDLHQRLCVTRRLSVCLSVRLSVYNLTLNILINSINFQLPSPPRPCYYKCNKSSCWRVSIVCALCKRRRRRNCYYEFFVLFFRFFFLLFHFPINICAGFSSREHSVRST